MLAACVSTDYAPVRFVVVGDSGSGNDAAMEVGAAMRDVCATQGCDLGLMLGDNIYDVGVNGADDPQWQEKYEAPFGAVGVEFLAVLGNHDYGGINNLGRAEAQIAYSATSDTFTMPDHFYERIVQNIGFYGLDTQAILLGPDGLDRDFAAEQGAWLDERLADAPPWRVAFAHHPYYSNGEHGDAGSYDGLSDELAVLSGAYVRDFADQHLCGKVDLYLTGHDHDREWLTETCGGTQLLVSGAGSKLRTVSDAHPTQFSDASVEGFFWIEIDDDILRVQAWSRAGELQYTGGAERDLSLGGR